MRVLPAILVCCRLFPPAVLNKGKVDDNDADSWTITLWSKKNPQAKINMNLVKCAFLLLQICHLCCLYANIFKLGRANSQMSHFIRKSLCIYHLSKQNRRIVPLQKVPQGTYTWWLHQQQQWYRGEVCSLLLAGKAGHTWGILQAGILELLWYSGQQWLISGVPVSRVTFSYSCAPSLANWLNWQLSFRKSTLLLFTIKSSFAEWRKFWIGAVLSVHCPEPHWTNQMV